MVASLTVEQRARGKGADKEKKESPLNLTPMGFEYDPKQSRRGNYFLTPLGLQQYEKWCLEYARAEQQGSVSMTVSRTLLYCAVATLVASLILLIL